MGGTEGNRGYLYQGIASVIKALTLDDWDRIYVEYSSFNDKIDIGFEKNQKLIRSIQVKSTLDVFSASDLRCWLEALTSDTPADSYELFLIGNCNGGAQKFKKSIEKYYEKKLDKEARKCFCSNSIDVGFLDKCRMKICVLPYDFISLKQIVIAALLEYLSSSTNKNLSYKSLDFIVDGLVANHMQLALTSEGSTRDDFKRNLDDRVDLLSEEYSSSKRIPLAIRSFSRGSSKIDVEDDHILDLEDLFDGCFVKSTKTWDQHILPSLSEFIRAKTSPKENYSLLLDAHSSIAFAAGRILDSKEGISIVPMQKTLRGVEVWEKDCGDISDCPMLSCSIDMHSSKTSDTAAIFSITHDVKAAVLSYIVGNGIDIGRIFHFSIAEGETGNSVVRHGAHCFALASAVQKYVLGRSPEEKMSTLHIFGAVPNAFMFFLGQLSRGFGSYQIYEYDFESRTSYTYFPTIALGR